MARLPIFPLNIVLFPGQTLPLHIFEERYKAMLQRCLHERIPFGLVLIRESGRMGRGTPHSIGTLARVVRVEEVPEGTCVVPAPHRGSCYNIVCFGEDRFRVESLDRKEAPYLVGDIEPYPDEPAPPAALAMVGQRVAALFDEYYRSIIALMGGWQRETEPGDRTMMFDMTTLVLGQSQAHGAAAPVGEDGDSRVISVPALPTNPVLLANIVASELNVQPDVKQELLEAPTTLLRLQREAEILAEETPRMQERQQLQIRRRFSGFGMTS
jgi:Lon protease-like protein